MNNNLKNIDIENLLAASVPFIFPEVEDIDDNQKDDRALEFLQKISYYVLPSKNPRITLSCLLWAVGIDVGLIYGTDNTALAISRILGISVQKFSSEVKKIRIHFNIKITSTKRHNIKELTYANNYRTPK